VPNYKVECDTWYTGAWGTTNGVAPVLVAPALTTPGAKDFTISIPAAQPSGNYTFAVRVTDSANPAVVSTFVWPGNVGLFPQSVFTEGFDNDTTLANWTLSGNATGFGDSQPAAGWDWHSVTGALYAPGAWGTANTVLNPDAGTRFAFFGTGSTTTGFPYYYSDGIARFMTTTNSYACNNGQLYTITLKTIGAAESGWDGLIPEVSWNNGATWSGISSSSAWSGLSYLNGGGGYGWTGQTTSWTTRSATFTATGTQFKMRFNMVSDGSVQYSSMGIDTILVQ